MSCAKYFNAKLRAALLIGQYPDWLTRHSRKSYIIAAVISSPDWCDRKALDAMRQEVKRKTEETGIEHVLDHIVPLNNPLVCGLTVPWNFQIITRTANAHKSNRYWPDMPETTMELF